MTHLRADRYVMYKYVVVGKAVNCFYRDGMQVSCTLNITAKKQLVEILKQEICKQKLSE